jgi:hypothetical protein
VIGLHLNAKYSTWLGRDPRRVREHLNVLGMPVMVLAVESFSVFFPSLFEVRYPYNRIVSRHHPFCPIIPLNMRGLTR